MTTQAVLHDKVRQHLGKRDTLNKLNGALTTSEDTIVLEYDTTKLAAGQRVSVDMQDYTIWSKVDATKTLTVETIAGTDASHADNSLVRCNPTYSPYEIGQAINDELDALPGDGLYAFDTVETTAGSATGYNLSGLTAFESGHRVWWLDSGTVGRWVPVNRRYWAIEADHETADFASGYALMLRDPFVGSGSRVRVQYKKQFTPLNLTTAGLAESVETISGADSWVIPILAVGAAIRLTLGQPSRRADLSEQSSTRRADEVTTADARLAQSPLQLERLQAIKRARREQIQKYGM